MNVNYMSNWWNKRRKLGRLEQRSNGPEDPSATGASARDSSSSASRYSRTARVLRDVSLQLTGSSPGTPRCRLASALMMLASTEAFALDQTGVHTATQHVIEQPAKQSAVPKTAVSIIGKGRVVGNFIFKAQTAEPEIRQIQMSLFAQPSL